MPKLTRRRWMKQSLGGFLVAASSNARAGIAETPSKEVAQVGCTLSFSTYGTQGIPVAKAIPLIAAAGFDGIEVAVQPGYDATPTELSANKRAELRRIIDSEGLKLTALMEHLSPAKEETGHREHLLRLEQVAVLANDLSPEAPPLIQTILGGSNWQESKNLFLDRLGGWLEVVADAKVKLAIKPHRGGAMSRPAEAIWLIEQLGMSTGLGLVYDYSHYAFRDMPLEETVQTALPYLAHVAVKDAVQQEGRVTFMLPGESGDFDYAELFRQLYKGGYRGDICCEVSGMVSKRSGYDLIAALKTCYQNMAKAFEAAEVPRPSGNRRS